jgi:hypothetical protein
VHGFYPGYPSQANSISKHLPPADLRLIRYSIVFYPSFNALQFESEDEKVSKQGLPLHVTVHTIEFRRQPMGKHQIFNFNFVVIRFYRRRKKARLPARRLSPAYVAEKMQSADSIEAISSQWIRRACIDARGEYLPNHQANKSIIDGRSEAI